MCIFESDTVKSDCPVQISRKMIKYLKVLIQTACLPYAQVTHSQIISPVLLRIKPHG